MKIASTIKVFILLALCAFCFTSCTTESYAEKRNKEKKAWADFKTANNLEISTDSAYCFNRATPWPENLYFQTHRGAFVRLIKDDTNQRHPSEGNTTIIRFLSYDLNWNLIGGNTGTSSREGEVSVYSPNGTDPCVGWNDVIPCLHHGSEAIMIIDSQLGPTDQQTNVITTIVHITDFSVTN